MAQAQELHLRIKVEDSQEENSKEEASVDNQPTLFPAHGHLRWWILLGISIICVICGTGVTTLLGRLYYAKGGTSKWLSTILATAAFPILFIPMFLYNPSVPTPLEVDTTSTDTITATQPNPSTRKLCFIYITFGLASTANSLLYSYGLQYLPVSTYSLLSATQLAFNAVFSYFINQQKLTPLILNSVVLLTLSASLVAMENGSNNSMEASAAKRVVGFLCTLGASAGLALTLSLTQYCFDKVLKKSFSVVWEIQVYPSIVATCGSLVGLFVSGEWKNLKGEMMGFEKGEVSYVMVLIWISVAYQITSIAAMWMIFEVSALFSNVIGTLTLPIIPALGVVFFHEKFSGAKVVAIILAFWGFLSYIYQQYLDDQNLKKAQKEVKDITKPKSPSSIELVAS